MTITLFIVMPRTGLLGTHAGLIVAYLAFIVPLAVSILRGFIETIPVELEEAALVDGATRFGAMVRIVLPLALPGLRIAGLGAEHGVGAQLWIQGFQMEPEDVADIATAVAAARQEGIEDLWTWGWEACAHMSALAGSDPARVWEALCEALTT